jgi:hypothetical protein
MALTIKSGVLKSISATHIGIILFMPNVSSLRSYLIQFVPSLFTGSSKFHIVSKEIITGAQRYKKMLMCMPLDFLLRMRINRQIRFSDYSIIK